MTQCLISSRLPLSKTNVIPYIVTTYSVKDNSRHTRTHTPTHTHMHTHTHAVGSTHVRSPAFPTRSATSKLPPSLSLYPSFSLSLFLPLSPSLSLSLSLSFPPSL